MTEITITSAMTAWDLAGTLAIIEHRTGQAAYAFASNMSFLYGVLALDTEEIAELIDSGYAITPMGEADLRNALANQ